MMSSDFGGGGNNRSRRPPAPPPADDFGGGGEGGESSEAVGGVLLPGSGGPPPRPSAPPAETLALWARVGADIDDSHRGTGSKLGCFTALCIFFSYQRPNLMSKYRLFSFSSTVPTVAELADVFLSLDAALKYFEASAEARTFAGSYTGTIVTIMVDLMRPRIMGAHSRSCVNESLYRAVGIVASDLEAQLENPNSGMGELTVPINILSDIFDKERPYYQDFAHRSPYAEVIRGVLAMFRSKNGLTLLNRLIMEKAGTGSFPAQTTTNWMLLVLLWASTLQRSQQQLLLSADEQAENERDVIALARSTMRYMSNLNEEEMESMDHTTLKQLRKAAQTIHDRQRHQPWNCTIDFYAFWRCMVLKLISPQSTSKLQELGWEEMDELLLASAEHMPIPKRYEVTGAGCSYVNGVYRLAYDPTFDRRLVYVRAIPATVHPGGGKKLTLFECITRSEQKWWFISEADEEQPGTDMDIDYYHCKPDAHGEDTKLPPANKKWFTSPCPNSVGIDPPPQVHPHIGSGVICYGGQENDVVNNQLAAWAIENGILDQVLSRSTASIKFNLIKLLAGRLAHIPP